MDKFIRREKLFLFRKGFPELLAEQDAKDSRPPKVSK
jgi:hypothetical protein